MRVYASRTRSGLWNVWNEDKNANNRARESPHGGDTLHAHKSQKKKVMVECMYDCMRSREGEEGERRGERKKSGGRDGGEAADNKSRRNGYIGTYGNRLRQIDNEE